MFPVDTPLGTAAGKGNLNEVRRLVHSGASIDDGGCLRTPLIFAAARGHVRIVRFLLKRGADATLANRFGWTPLQAACSSGNPVLVEHILAQGVPIETYDRFTWETPFLTACALPTSHIARRLLRCGADLTTRNIHRETALHIAAAAGCASTVELLLAQGLKPNARDKRGRTPLHKACSGRLYGGRRYTKQRAPVNKIIDLLLKAGAKHDTPDWLGTTPFDQAGYSHFTYARQAMLLKGAKPITDEDHRFLIAKAALLIAHLLKILQNPKAERR